MKLYSIENVKLKNIDPHDFKLERDIQKIVENNLEELFNLKFVKSEFSIKNFRIDTLTYDEENKSFVIVEYKKDKNYSVIDQGYTYMSLLLNNKSDFVLEFNECCRESLKRSDIDWSQSRVIFISPQFTEFQKHSINFKDVPFELWEINRYKNNLIGLVQHKTTSQESVSTISTEANNVVNQVAKEIKVYTEEYHLTQNRKVAQDIIELYEEVKQKILTLDGIGVAPRKLYISFQKNSKPICHIVIFSNQLNFVINMKKGELYDPYKLTKDLSEQGHWGVGDYQVKIKDNTELDKVMLLIKQSYEKQR